jgi:hypothetical protein
MVNSKLKITDSGIVWWYRNERKGDLKLYYATLIC